MTQTQTFYCLCVLLYRGTSYIAQLTGLSQHKTERLVFSCLLYFVLLKINNIFFLCYMFCYNYLQLVGFFASFQFWISSRIRMWIMSPLSNVLRESYFIWIPLYMYRTFEGQSETSTFPSLYLLYRGQTWCQPCAQFSSNTFSTNGFGSKAFRPILFSSIWFVSMAYFCPNCFHSNSRVRLDWTKIGQKHNGRL